MKIVIIVMLIVSIAILPAWDKVSLSFKHILLAVLVGWLTYLMEIFLAIVFIPGFYEPLMIIAQPIVGLFVSVATVVLSLLAGLLLRIPPIQKQWTSSYRWGSLIIAISLFLLCFGYSLGLHEVHTFSTAEGEAITYQWLRSDVSLISHFCLIFCIANWPSSKKYE